MLSDVKDLIRVFLSVQVAYLSPGTYNGREIQINIFLHSGHNKLLAKHFTFSLRVAIVKLITLR